MPDDFQEWYATMCSQFESRFGRLFRGPMWSGCERDDIKNPLVVARKTNQRYIVVFIERMINLLKDEVGNSHFDNTENLACYNFTTYFMVHLKLISPVILKTDYLK